MSRYAQNVANGCKPRIGISERGRGELWVIDQRRGTCASLPVLNAALWDENAVPARFSELVANTHAERITGVIDQILKTAGWNLSDLTVMAVTNGPGSFTGIRVALSFAKGLGLALGINLDAAKRARKIGNEFAPR